MKPGDRWRWGWTYEVDPWVVTLIITTPDDVQHAISQRVDDGRWTVDAWPVSTLERQAIIEEKS